MSSLNISQKLQLIQISGEDSANFLNSQLTQDINNLNSEQARLFAYCSPKGRMLANGIIYKHIDTYYMLVDASIVSTFSKRLSMYILRSKVKITVVEASSYFISYVKLQNNINNFLNTVDKTSENNTYYINWYQDKYIAITNNIINVEDIISTSIGLNEFVYDSILQGIFFINSTNVEEYVPQMLNFEKLGGVNFKKGCYPGQEIVARSQYLGKIKKTSIYAVVGCDDNIKYENINIDIITDDKSQNIDNVQIVDSIYFNNKLHFILCIRSEYLSLQGFALLFNANNDTNYAKHMDYKLYFENDASNKE
ncbi:MAG: hypothetical protein RLZZ210_1505 [Pseudomonadota bacterium]|jgi:folate-binding protein YgfZ